MSLRKRIKAFLRDDELHKRISELRTDVDVLGVKLDAALKHIDRVSVQVAALDALEYQESTEPFAVTGKPRRAPWPQRKKQLEAAARSTHGAE